MENQYFIPKILWQNHYITKQFLISVLFPDASAKKQQKILKKTKELRIWNTDNDIFELVVLKCSTCRNNYHHDHSNFFYDMGDCYDNKVEYTRELLKIKLQNISDDQKTENAYFHYHINLSVLTGLRHMFSF